MEEPKRPSNIASATELVADSLAMLFERWGFRQIDGQCWAHLFLSQEPIDAASLQQTLDVSSGSLNTTLRKLVELEFVYREAPNNNRRYLYRAETDIWLVVTRLFRERARDRLKLILSNITEAEHLLETAEPLSQKKSREKSRENDDIEFKLTQIRHLLSVGNFLLGTLDAIAQRTRIELRAARKWISVSEKLGGEPLRKIRQVINATRRN
jgi:DNA-binding transcriptional regulator GbsR (MarR family)